MPFEHSTTAPKRIAVIGAGISGMGAARYLSDTHHVVVFETEHRLGGHARTVIAGKRGDQPVDTGFIVFNYANYPNLARLFEELDVPVAPSNMSFGASIGGGRIEYGTSSVWATFAQKRNWANPAFFRMIRDIFHFNANALAAADDPALTVGGLLDKLGTGRWFRDHYLLPFSGAIWSMPKREVLDFPAQAMLRFFDNHALLSYDGQHQWYTVQGGSIEYVRRLGSSLYRRGVDIRLGADVAAVRRTRTGAEVRVAGDDWEAFDEVVFATHSDQSLALLSDANGVERTALSAIRYQPNEAVLHCDERLMPRRKIAWSAWNYIEAADKTSDVIDLTYWMNALQPIPKDDPLFVTLNATQDIRDECIYDTATFAHPVYDLAALAAQDTIRAINGQNATWFCGAWMKNGFHEDGLSSALDVVAGIQTRDAMGIAAE